MIGPLEYPGQNLYLSLLHLGLLSEMMNLDMLENILQSLDQLSISEP